MCYQLLGKERSNTVFPSSSPCSSAQGRNDVLHVCKGPEWAAVGHGGWQAAPGLASQKAVEPGMDGAERGGRQPRPGQIWRSPRPPLHQGMLGSDWEPERQVWSMVWDSCVPWEPRFPRRKLTYFSLPRRWNASEKELEGEVGVEEVSKEPCSRNPDSLCRLQLIEGSGLVLFVLASKALLRMS